MVYRGDGRVNDMKKKKFNKKFYTFSPHRSPNAIGCFPLPECLKIMSIIVYNISAINAIINY